MFWYLPVEKRTDVVFFPQSPPSSIARFDQHHLILDDYRRVWVPDTVEGFLPAWVKKQGDDTDQESTAEVVMAASGETRTVPIYALSPMNPPQFDGVEDIADLTHLNEASVAHNLRLRYGAGDIYVSY